jgi:hypothetical protein
MHTFIPRIDCQLNVIFGFTTVVLPAKIELVEVVNVFGRNDESDRVVCVMLVGAMHGRARWNKTLATIVTLVQEV